jgi:hypothetical protein
VFCSTNMIFLISCVFCTIASEPSFAKFKSNHTTRSDFFLVFDNTDGRAPVASARVSGSLEAPNVYSNEAELVLSVGAPATSVQYAINDSGFVNYRGPVRIQKPGRYTVKVKVADSNNNEVISRPFKFRVIEAGERKVLSFSKKKLTFTVLKGMPVNRQSTSVVADAEVSLYHLSKTKAPWLNLPETTTGILRLGPAQINSNIAPGHYRVMVTCTAPGYEAGTLMIDLHVVEPLDNQAININFQDPQTIPPLGHLRDFGQPFGLRTGAYQGVGLYYGWKKRVDGSLLDLTANGRNRNAPDDVLLATLIHMQANHIKAPWKGVKTEGYWEVKVPNGTYDVTVSAGDGSVTLMPERHILNVEGISAVKAFVPNGKKGTISRFKSATVRVKVNDEYLTINADGGKSTKINYVNIVPVSLRPYLYWSNKTSNIILKKGSAGKNIFSVVLGASNNAVVPYKITASYSARAKGWLKFNPSPKAAQTAVTFDYSAAGKLAPGIYKASVKVTSEQYTSAVMEIQLNVVDKARPYVVSSTPVNGERKVSLNTASIAANSLSVPVAKGHKGGIDNSTITNRSVGLLKYVNGVYSGVKGVVQGTGGGDAISFTPFSRLEPNTVYRFIVTAAVKSYAGVPIAPYEATFTTDAAEIDSTNILNAQFTRVPLPGTQNKKYSSLTVGPDGKLYALRLDGVVERFVINHTTGMLTGLQAINTLVKKRGIRSAVGIAFDPKSTASNLILYVTHSSGGLSGAPEFDGNLSRLQGPNLETEELLITRLPRSKRDHLINSIAFGPDGALYMSQGSNSSAGLYDDDWQQEESLLAGTVLRLDLNKLKTFRLPLDVQTTANQNLINNAPAVSATMKDGTYNPYGKNSPLTIYASGVRNAFDLLWHSNGQLYLPTNGSGGGGNSPASVAGTRRVDGTFYKGPAIPATSGTQVQHDWLFRVNPNKPVGYFGHPNPLRGEYVLNRGYDDNSLYLPSVKADVNYRPGYDFGLNKSPNGVIEYKSNAFNGALKGKLLVCRFSGGGDITVMEPGSMVKTANKADDSIYDIVKVTTGSGNSGLVGMSGFGNPLDLVEDVVNGNLYVIEYNWNNSPNLVSQITLLRAKPLPSQVVPAKVQKTAKSVKKVVPAKTKN